jgi:predicted flap endonuclease-1-like 5' DNA nuclease
MWLLWLLIGIVLGAAIVWIVIRRRIDEQTAATEANFDARLRHVQAEVGRADQAHEETKAKLHELLADRNAVSDRADRLVEEAAAARRATATAQAQEVKLDGELAMARNEAAAAKAELAQCRERRRALEAEAAAAKALVEELEARIRGMPAAATAGAGDGAAPPPPGAAAHGDPAEPALRLRAIEARLAALPVGTPAPTALIQERDELLRATGGDLPLPGGPRVDDAPATVYVGARPPLDATAQRVKAIEAKLRMLPAGSSARAALLAEKARLQDGAGASTPPPLPTAPAGTAPDDLEVIKGIGPFINRELAAMGIVTFAQLVALTPKQIGYLEDKIGFPGRVGREHWIEQARSLMGDSKPG